MRLASQLDLRAAAPLREELVALSGKPLEVDASQVERLGGVCLQVLLAAEASWRARGLGFSIASPSPAFEDASRLMGVAWNLTGDESK